MLALPKSLSLIILRRCSVLPCLGGLVLGAGQANALPPDRLEGSPRLVLVQATRPGGQVRWRTATVEKTARTETQNIIDPSRPPQYDVIL